MESKQNQFYQCTCGKIFTNSQAFNGHKTNCKEHQLKKYGTLDFYLDRLERTKASNEKTHRVESQQKLEKRLQVWIAEKHQCETCGKVMTEKYGSGRFCCRSCANTHKHSEETKIKLAAAANRNLFTYVCNNCNATFVSSNSFIEPQYCLCKNCKKETHAKKDIKSLLDMSKRTVTKILKRAGAACSICGWNDAVCDVHHIIPKSQGGTDDNGNLIIICPNCHRKIHSGVNFISSEELISKSILFNADLWLKIQQAYHPSN